MRFAELSSVENAVLRTKDGVEVVARSLWEKQPAFIYCLRRPGCVMCRDNAQQVWQQREALEQAGLRVVLLVHEWIDREVNAFAPAFWGGELYHDVDKTFYKALGDGKLRKRSELFLINPFHAAWKRILAAHKRVPQHNINGDGSVLGGMLVVGKGNHGIQFMQVERTFGEYPPITEVVEAAIKAAAA